MKKLIVLLMALMLMGACLAEGSLPVATIEMADGGVMKLELYPDIAPNTAANFIELANAGFYDGLIFHRVIPGFMIQGGCPNGTGMGGPGYTIKGEFARNGYRENNLRHKRGVLSMARSMMPNSAGSQFFIMHADGKYLDGKYAAFGKLADQESLVTLDMIANTPTDARDKPLVERKIKTITVDTKGYTYTTVKEEE